MQARNESVSPDKRKMQSKVRKAFNVPKSTKMMFQVNPMQSHCMKAIDEGLEPYVEKLAAVDRVAYDLDKKQVFNKHRSKQFNALYTQMAYEVSLQQDKPSIPEKDAYWKFTDRVTKEERDHMLVVIEELVNLRSYFDKTFYLAVNLCDRYMLSLSRKKQVPHCLMDLAVAAVFLAGKIEQHICPSIEVLLHTIDAEW